MKNHSLKLGINKTMDINMMLEREKDNGRERE